ncbi:MAG: GAK system XXXCH domain-containing protein [Pseudomonadota bacterium]
MGSTGLSLEAELPLDQVAVLLHQTADALATGVLRLGDEARGLEELREVQISLKQRDGVVRLKIRGRAARASAQKDSRGGYKALKKDMSRTWKAMQRLARRGEMPGLALGDRFHAQGERMMGYPDKGSSFYPAFARALESLREASHGDEIDGFREAVARIEKLKKAAHRRYK